MTKYTQGLLKGDGNEILHVLQGCRKYSQRFSVREGTQLFKNQPPACRCRLLKRRPRWYGHMRDNAVFDGDNVSSFLIAAAASLRLVVSLALAIFYRVALLAAAMYRRHGRAFT